MKASASDPVERVLNRMFYPFALKKKPVRFVYIDEAGKVRSGHESTHLSPLGVRYRMFIRLRARLRGDR